jgi:hypothetical protein
LPAFPDQWRSGAGWGATDPAFGPSTVSGVVRPVLLLLRFIAIVVTGSVFAVASIVAVGPRIKDFVTANSSVPSEISLDKLAATSMVLDRKSVV